MKIPEYKLKWLEKQLKLYDESERSFFENYDLVSAVMLDKYLGSRPELTEEPLLIFLRQYARDAIQSHKRFMEQNEVPFDVSCDDVQICAVCAAWSVDLLLAYDKWKKNENR